MGTMECGLAQQILANGAGSGVVHQNMFDEVRPETSAMGKVLQKPRIAHEIGVLAGAQAARRVTEVSKTRGAAMRIALRKKPITDLPDFYVCGGQSGDQILNDMYRYDLSRGVWEQMPPMPTARSFCTAATVAGKVYVLGGERDQRPAFAATECYHPSEKEWRRLPPMPTARAGSATAVVGDRIYVFGGLSVAWHVLPTVECFNTSRNRWSCLPPMPSPRCGCAAVSVGHRIFIFGGQVSRGNVLNSADVLDTETGTWDTLADMPTARAGCSAAVLRSLVTVTMPQGPTRQRKSQTTRTTIYVIGGLNAQGCCLASMERYVVDLDEWEEAVAAPLARAGSAVASMGSSFFVCGGFNNARQDILQTDIYDEDAGEWQEVEALPRPRRLSAATMVWP